MAYHLIQSPADFPPLSEADEDGLLGIAGELSPKFLIAAYKRGIFPWFNEGDPILWWSPDPRLVLYPEKFKVSKSFRNILNQRKFKVTFNDRFEDVMRRCGQIERPNQEGTWISEDMIEAYVEMHRLGWAHSVEVWKDESLVGGVYGLAIGKLFFGESMFAQVPNASKVGLYALCQRLIDLGVPMIDCQQETPHLKSLGAEAISRADFEEKLKLCSPISKLDIRG